MKKRIPKMFKSKEYIDFEKNLTSHEQKMALIKVIAKETANALKR